MQKPQKRTGGFSSHELRTIEERFGLVPVEKIAKKLNRSAASVARKAQAIFEEKPMNAAPWTEEEADRLRAYYGACDIDTLALVLRRDPEDVLGKAEELRKVAATCTAPLSRVERRRLKSVYGSRTTGMLVVVLGRAESVIEAAANEERLSKDKTFRKRMGQSTRMPRWTDAEIETLRRIYPDTSNREVAESMGRSVKSIVSKANGLGLTKSQERLRTMGRENVRIRYEQ